MEALLAFAAALLAFRFAGELAARWRERRRPELLAWSASLLTYALASGALAWGAAAGWGDAAFRLYYLFGGLLTAVLLGAGSLLVAGRRWAAPVAIAYAGLAVGLVLAEPLASPVAGTAIPEAQAHLELFPVRIVAIVANSLGTVAVVAVALATLRRRPLGNALVVAGTAVAGLGAAPTAAFVALAAVLLYVGFLGLSGLPLPRLRAARRPELTDP